MNIAIFASAFHPSLGGVEELCRQLGHHLRDAGHSAGIFTNRWPKTLSAVDEFEGLPVRRYVFRVPERNVRQFGGAMLYGASARRAMCAELVKQNIDVLHVQCVSSNAYYALQAKRRLGLPLVVSLQGELTMDASGLFQRSTFAQKLMRSALAHADAITACSKQTLMEAEAFFGRPFGDRARVVYNGIRLAEFEGMGGYQHACPYIFALGRHVPQKGFDVLLRAYAAALGADSGLTHDLLVAGDGVCHGELRILATALGLKDRVHFLGRTDRATTAALFNGCSFFVLPSRHEPMGIVNLEAMAARKAVIASRVGGVPELVSDGETGLLVAGGDEESLAAAIGRLAHDEPLRGRLGEAGRSRAEGFNWATITREYVAIYNRVLVKAPMGATVAS